MLPGRTNAAVKNFWYAFTRRSLSQGGAASGASGRHSGGGGTGSGMGAGSGLDCDSVGAAFSEEHCQGDDDGADEDDGEGDAAVEAAMVGVAACGMEGVEGPCKAGSVADADADAGAGAGAGAGVAVADGSGPGSSCVVLGSLAPSAVLGSPRSSGGGAGTCSGTQRPPLRIKLGRGVGVPTVRNRRMAVWARESRCQGTRAALPEASDSDGTPPTFGPPARPAPSPPGRHIQQRATAS
jgi:hypothetical protein